MTGKYGKAFFYQEPANDFREALPVGNGRIGALLFGGIVEEKVLLNESTLWSGSDSYEYPDDVYKVLPEIQELVLQEKYAEADEKYINEFLTVRPVPSDGANSGCQPYGSMQSMGELDLSFFQMASGCYQEWYPYEMTRELDMQEGVVNYRHHSYTAYWEANTPGFDKGPLYYERKALVSKEYECFAMRLSAAKPGRIGFNAQLRRSEHYRIRGIDHQTLLMEGQLDDGHGKGGVRYACLMKIVPQGGEVCADGTVLQIRGADSAVIYITAATDMKSFGGRNLDDPVQAVMSDMEKAVSAGWDRILKDHTESHRELYDRVSLQINAVDEEIEALSMRKRLQRVGNGQRDDGLMVLLFNYGRYLLISSSRPGGLPAGIEGIWNEELQAPFNGDYHINAQQETYWHAECCNLPELHEPYLKLTEALVKNGSDVAKKFYDSNGWVAHTITNPWCYTLPGSRPNWGATIVGGAWLCIHLWEHYLYNEDEEYLKWAYPIMKGAAQFLLDRLIEDPQTGSLVIFPGNSPENFFEDKEGNPVCICLGSAYDMGITRSLFKAIVEAACILDTDQEFASLVKKQTEKLAGYRIGKDGRIMEWQRDVKEYKPFHRHISPLWAVFPGDEISREDTPQLADASLKLLEERTFTGHMWAMTWRCLVMARLREGNKVDETFQTLMYYGICANLFAHVYFTRQDERTPETDFQTPFDNKAIFEIDGNMGFTAAVVEMLMQSYRKENDLRVIELLPALPDLWENGCVKGIRARGDFLVDIEWENHQLKKAVIKARKSRKCLVRYKGKTVMADFSARDEVVFTPDDFSEK